MKRTLKVIKCEKDGSVKYVSEKESTIPYMLRLSDEGYTLTPDTVQVSISENKLLEVGEVEVGEVEVC